MSEVTNVILTTAAGETIHALNAAWDFAGCPMFSDVSYTSAGCKHLECNVYLGGFNHLDLERFIATVKGIAWDYPASVQLFVLEEHDERFREIGLWERGE